MLTKEYIKDIKQSGNIEYLIKKHITNSGDLVFILENLGHLSTSFNASVFYNLLNHDNENVRFWSVKNIGKLKSADSLVILNNLVNTDKSTLVKREAVSSIGRMRDKKSIPILIHILSDSDPRIICQAIRALLVFNGDVDVNRKSTRLNSSHIQKSSIPSSA